MTKIVVPKLLLHHSITWGDRNLHLILSLPMALDYKKAQFFYCTIISRYSSDVDVTSFANSIDLYNNSIAIDG